MQSLWHNGISEGCHKYRPRIQSPFDHLSSVRLLSSLPNITDYVFLCETERWWQFQMVVPIKWDNRRSTTLWLNVYIKVVVQERSVLWVVLSSPSQQKLRFNLIPNPPYFNKDLFLIANWTALQEEALFYWPLRLSELISVCVCVCCASSRVVYHFQDYSPFIHLELSDCLTCPFFWVIVPCTPLQYVLTKSSLSPFSVH